MILLNEVNDEKNALWQNQELALAIKDNLNSNPAELALSLQSLSTEERIFVVEQVKGYQKARNKFPFLADHSNFIYPPTLSIEQASSELTARFKSSLVKGKYLIDLTCGMGIDAYFMGLKFDRITLVDENESLLKIIKQNFLVLNKSNVKFYHQSAEDFVNSFQRKADWIFIDPSRRASAQRFFRIEECKPHVLDLMPQLLKISDNLMIKLSPMADIQEMMLKIPLLSEIYVLSADGECKELLITVSKNIPFDGMISSVDLSNIGNTIYRHSISREKELDTMILPMGNYTYLPNTSVVKAGAFKSLCDDFQVGKISKSTHIYTSTQLIEGFPGRTFKCIQVLPFSKKTSKELSDSGYIIIKRNIREEIKEIKAKLRITDYGRHYLLVYKNALNKSEVAICELIST